MEIIVKERQNKSTKSLPRECSGAHWHIYLRPSLRRIYWFKVKSKDERRNRKKKWKERTLSLPFDYTHTRKKDVVVE